MGRRPRSCCRCVAPEYDYLTKVRTLPSQARFQEEQGDAHQSPRFKSVPTFARIIANPQMLEGGITVPLFIDE